MRIVVLSVGALLTLGLLTLASHVVWRQVQSLRYLRDLDEWAEEVPEW